MSSQYGDPYEEWKAQGRPGGSFAAWQASQGGGAAPQVTGGSVAAPTATPGGPGAFNQAWMNEGLAAYNAGQRGSDPLRTPGFDPNTFRQNYAAQAGGNRPEDLARFSNETLAGWMPFYDPGTGKYRSMRGAEGWYDKPTECPPGQGPSGPNETDPCTSQGYSNQPAQAAQPVAGATQGVLGPLGGTPQKGVALPAPVVSPIGGNESPYTNTAPSSPLQPIMTGLQGQTANPVMTSGLPQTGSLTSLIAPLQGGFAAPAQPQAGLTNMLAGQQKRKVNAWF